MLIWFGVAQHAMEAFVSQARRTAMTAQHLTWATTSSNNTHILLIDLENVCI
jgi:hypothetical protein